jgi:hypothetical protein
LAIQRSISLSFDALDSNRADGALDGFNPVLEPAGSATD